MDALFARGSLGNFLGGLVFEGDHIGVGSEEARHLAGQVGVEGLIDGGEDTAGQQARDQVFGADPSFSARSLTLMPSVMVMLRVIGCGHWRATAAAAAEALHRAFLHTARHIALSWPA